jgi:hypothetical protein
MMVLSKRGFLPSVFSRFWLVGFAAAVLTLAGCGGGGGGGGATTSTTTGGSNSNTNSTGGNSTATSTSGLNEVARWSGPSALGAWTGKISIVVDATGALHFLGAIPTSIGMSGFQTDLIYGRATGSTWSSLSSIVAGGHCDWRANYRLNQRLIRSIHPA